MPLSIHVMLMRTAFLGTVQEIKYYFYHGMNVADFSKAICELRQCKWHWDCVFVALDLNMIWANHDKLCAEPSRETKGTDHWVSGWTVLDLGLPVDCLLCNLELSDLELPWTPWGTSRNAGVS